MSAGFAAALAPRIVRAEPNAALLIVTDPPDPLADIVRETCPGAVVLSTGTQLDSQRFRVHVGKHFGVDPAHVHAQVIGDHGDESRCTRRRPLTSASEI